MISLTRGGSARLCAPDMVGQEGDIIHLAVRRDAIDALHARLEGTGPSGFTTTPKGRSR